MTRTLIAGTAAAALGLALAGCGGKDEPTAQSTTPTTSPSAPVTSATASAGPGEDDSTEPGILVAGRTVLERLPGTTLTSIDLENTGWDVTVVDREGVETTAFVDTSDRTIVRGPTRQDDDAEDRAEHRAQVDGVRVDFAAAAAEIAKTEIGQVHQLELDDYRGKTVWEATVEGDARQPLLVRMDPRNGQVISKTLGQSADDDD